jgi:hypothetical protein
MRIKFPTRRADGSFCVEVRLRIDSSQPNLLASRLTAWLDQWSHANRYWKWPPARNEGGLLDYFDDFLGAATAVVCSSTIVCLRFECRPEAKKWWKDWLVFRILRDIHEAFIEIIAVEKIGNCP